MYVLFSSFSSRPYVGKCHASDSWRLADRFKGHMGDILKAARGDPPEDKYMYMHTNGGVGSWFLLPMLRIPSPVPKQQLSKVETSLINQFSPNLNQGWKYRNNGAPRGSGRKPM